MIWFHRIHVCSGMVTAQPLITAEQNEGVRLPDENNKDRLTTPTNGMRCLDLRIDRSIHERMPAATSIATTPTQRRQFPHLKLISRGTLSQLPILLRTIPGIVLYHAEWPNTSKRKEKGVRKSPMLRLSSNPYKNVVIIAPHVHPFAPATGHADQRRRRFDSKKDN